MRRPVYSPALVAFMIRDHDVSVHASMGLPGLWWVALSWGEPVVPWWSHHRHRGHPRWDGWGGPRLVNNVVVNPATVINVGDIHYHNASLPRAILTVPADTFGRERIRATMENRYPHTDLAPVRGELPVKPSRASLFGGAPKGLQPPKDIVARPVVSTRTPRERPQPWQDEAPRVRPPSAETRYVVPPARRADDARSLPPRPPYGVEAGPERAPLPLPPRYGEVKKTGTPPSTLSPHSQTSTHSQTPTREQATVRSQPPAREQTTERREAKPATRPAEPSTTAPPTSRSSAPPAQAPARTQIAPPHGEVRREEKERPMPGQPASQTYRGRDQDNREAR